VIGSMQPTMAGGVFSDQHKAMGAFFLLRQTDLTDLAQCVCRSFIRPAFRSSFFNDGLKSSECSDFRRSFVLDN